MPQATRQRSGAQTAAEVGAGAAVAVGAVATAAPAVGAVNAAQATAAAAARTLAASIMAAFVTFLAALRHQHQTWLAGELPKFTDNRDDVAQAMGDEMRLEHEFAKASADRVASALPQALAIADPQERDAAVRKILAAEERYAAQRAEAMAARAIAAVNRLSVRSESPLGAFWRLGQAHKHTEGCLRMAGKFWPWAVLDRVHPPRHYGCTSSLATYDEAIESGEMSPGDVPDTRAAIRAAAGVVMEAEEADALIRELDVRDELRELGIDEGLLESIDLRGVRDGAAEAVSAAQ